MNGILNIHKEPGYTSFDVVAKLRGICRQKKIGHTGTLDPAASGVLPVCLGNATRLCGMLTDKDKEYRAVLLLGRETDTQDATGRTLAIKPVEISQEQAIQAILSFEGGYDQIPPMYSALKVNGKKLCDLARAGKEVDRKSRSVVIHSIRIEEISLPRVTMTVCCSKGTYIRTLCHDIGQALGCGGVMETLVRTRSGQFKLEDARTLSQIEALAQEGRLQEILIPTDAVFVGYPALYVRQEWQRLAENGNALLQEYLTEPGTPGEGQQARVYTRDGRFLGVYAWQEEKARWKPVKMFVGKDA